MGKKIKDFFIGIWERINQIDVPDGYEDLDKREKAEVENVNKVQKEVHEQRSFAQRVKVDKNSKKVDPLMAKYGPAEPGNPIFDAGQRLKEMEDKEIGEK